MIIRIAKKEDVKNLLPLFIEYNKFLWKLLPKKESFFKNPRDNFDNYIKKSLNQMISDKKHKMLVAEIDNALVGSISGWINNYKNSLFEDSCKVGTFGYLIVKKDFQNNGISSKLKEGIFNWFKEKKCKFVTLEVNTNNPAKNIYKKWNFKTYSEKMLIPL
jgi:ribosomal protein S18 acetylase RimI-like enzyme